MLYIIKYYCASISFYLFTIYIYVRTGSKNGSGKIQPKKKKDDRGKTDFYIKLHLKNHPNETMLQR